MQTLKFKFILQIFFVIVYFSTLNAKTYDKFESKDYISNYFSGILLLNDNQYNESYDFLKKLKGLEKNHINYSSKYLFSLVNSGKLNEAFQYSKRLEKTKLSNFESELVLGIYYLKNNNYDLAKSYALKLKNRRSNFVVNDFVSNSLLNWLNLLNSDFKTAEKAINQFNSNFENLKSIQNVFLHCFFKSSKTEFHFKNLVSNKKTDFSRYNYFYAKYLISIGETNKAKNIIEEATNLNPDNLILSQYDKDLKINKNLNDFDCQNLSHIIAEVFYITADALASQNMISFSNFYLNLSKFLNNDFNHFDLLIAENFYKLNNRTQAEKYYKKISKNGEVYLWFSATQKANLLLKEKKNSQALQTLSSTFKKITEKTIYIKYDYARILKNNDKFKEAIKLYTEIIDLIDESHPLYPKAMDGRGVSYERIGKWDLAEKDLLSSLKASPEQAYVINYLAYSWIEKGIKIKKSLNMLEKANSLRSNDPYIIDSLGWALYKLKNYNESKKYLQSAVQLMPADPIINDHYGDVLWKNGNRLQARYYWKYVLNLEETEKELRNEVKNKLISGL